MEDQNVIELLKKGDHSAFKVLYDHYPMIKNMVLSNSGSEEDAKDLFQNVLIAFYKNVKKGDFILTSKISTYLYSIANNLWLKQLSNKNKKYVTNLDKAKELVKEEQHFEFQETKKMSLREFIFDKLDKIGEPCKSILLLHEYEKLSMQQISIKLGYANEHTARQQKYKCIQRLKKIIPLEAKTVYLS